MSEIKIPGPQISFPDLIDYCLTEQEDNFEAFPLRPSAAGKCSKALAMELAEYQGRAKWPKEQRAPNVKRLLALGHGVEYQAIKNFDLIQKASPNFKIKYKQQILTLFRIPDGPLVEGSCDLCVVDKITGEMGILDVKSTKVKHSSAFATDWEERISKLAGMQTVIPLGESGFYVEDLPAFLDEYDDEFKKDYFYQVNSYCHSAFAQEHGVAYGSLYFYEKNSSQHLEIRFKPSQEIFEQVKNKFIRVYNHVRSTESPESLRELPCDFHTGTIKAAFCPCVTYSGRDQKEAMNAWFATFPKRKWPTDIEKIESEWHLPTLFEEYETAAQQAEQAEKLEAKIAKELSDQRISKVRLTNGRVYEVKNLKTGGPMNGPRVVLRRSKA